MRLNTIAINHLPQLVKAQYYLKKFVNVPQSQIPLMRAAIIF